MALEEEQVASSLRELGALTDRTRAASRSMITGFPMIGWGVAWIVGMPAVELLDGVPRIVAATAAWLTGMLMSWWPRRASIRTGTERKLRVAWVVVFGAMPFLVSAAQPASLTHTMLLLGALWGVAMCLYAIATDDRAYAAVAGFGTVVAGVVAAPDLANPLVCYGMAAGIPMVALGAVRVFQGVRHV